MNTDVGHEKAGEVRKPKGKQLDRKILKQKNERRIRALRESANYANEELCDSENGDEGDKVETKFDRKVPLGQ